MGGGNVGTVEGYGCEGGPQRGDYGEVGVVAG